MVSLRRLALTAGLASLVGCLPSTRHTIKDPVPFMESEHAQERFYDGIGLSPVYELASKEAVSGDAQDLGYTSDMKRLTVDRGTLRVKAFRPLIEGDTVLGSVGAITGRWAVISPDHLMINSYVIDRDFIHHTARGLAHMTDGQVDSLDLTFYPAPDDSAGVPATYHLVRDEPFATVQQTGRTFPANDVFGPLEQAYEKVR